MISFHPKYFIKTNKEEEKIYEFCNIICFQVDDILKQAPEKGKLPLGEFQICSICESVFVNKSCMICNSNARLFLPYQTSLEYETVTKVSDFELDNPIVVFCIDISGSMRGKRLETVRKACIATLEKLKIEKPSTKVALITFESSASYWGDQNRKIRDISNMPSTSITRKTENLRSISESYNDLRNALSSIQATGGTNICAALYEAISLATEVILCTDGEAGDENIQYYDDLIKFSKLNNIRINVITFDDANCKLAVLGKFANETNGLVSRTSDSIVLTNNLIKMTNEAVNIPSKTRFKLVFNKQEIKINDTTSIIEENVTDRLHKWMYTTTILKTFQSFSTIVLQLQIYDSNIVRVVTVKRDISQNVVDFANFTSLNTDLLHAMISISLIDSITQEAKQFREVKEKVENFQELYKRLNVSIVPVSVKSLFDVILKQNPNYNFKNLNDQDSFIIYNSKNLSKESINMEKLNVSKNNDEDQILQVETNYQKLSSTIKNELQQSKIITTSSLIKNFSLEMKKALDKISSSYGLRTRLLLLKQLLFICKTFLPIINANLNESISSFGPITHKQPSYKKLSNNLFSPDKEAIVSQLNEKLKLFIVNIESTGLLSADTLIQQKYLHITNLIKKDMSYDAKPRNIELNNITSILNTKLLELLNIQQTIHKKSQEKNSSLGKQSHQKNEITEQVVKVTKNYYNRIATDESYSKQVKETSTTLKKDTFGNLAGNVYDLAADKAFNGFQIAVLQFYSFDFQNVEKSLKEKGFIVHKWTTLPSTQEFEDVLNKSCQLWLISDSHALLQTDHLELIKKFYENKNGIYVWGDNYPYYADANNVTKYLINCSMHGNSTGCQVVSVQNNPNESGLVSTHIVNTGLTNLYEGETIATIENTNNELEPIMFGSAKNLIVAAYNKNGKRLIVDGGFTRLFPECWDKTPGTDRYVKNAAAWLANIENKFNY